jgi:hypothetical protein
VRSLITDLALDILLYQSAYREHIMISVLNECNRIYKLFKERHPEFDGKIHLMGHSLGSAILLDLLCRQREIPDGVGVHQKREKHRNPSGKIAATHLDFDFDVEDFYCLGSPIGLFQVCNPPSHAAIWGYKHAWVPSATVLTSGCVADAQRANYNGQA